MCVCERFDNGRGVAWLGASRLSRRVITTAYKILSGVNHFHYSGTANGQIGLFGDKSQV